MPRWHSALRYNLVSAQIAGFHYLHILVVNFYTQAHFGTGFSIVITFLTYFSYAANHTIHSTWFSWKDYLWQHPKRRSPLGWGLVIVVAIAVALVDLSTCWLIVQWETDALLRHSVEGLRLVERRSHHYHTVSVIAVKQCPSARHVKM